MRHQLIGAKIGKYEIVELLGRGATACVYKAHQPVLDRHVAIKVLYPFLAADEDFLRRFRREAQSIAALRHPRIVQIYDFAVVDDRYCLVMEYINGHTLETQLQEMMSAGEVMPLDEAIDIVRDVASILSYAHSRDMVHRDIKPANVMVNRENHVILTDFGIAKLLSGTRHTATGSVIGTPHYMAPEQGLGEPGDSRSDLYSLGAMFFQMVTGRLPYDADTAVAVLIKHINDPLPIPSQINPSLPAGVDSIILKAMAKNPDERYQTADELVESLDLITVEAIAPRPTEPMPAVEKPSFPPAAASQRKKWLTSGMLWQTPYTLSYGNVAATPSQLPSVCDANWERAVEHFVKGYITQWLQETVDTLRSTHQHDLADSLDWVVARAEAIVERVRRGDEIDRGAGLETFLELVGGDPPVLEISPERLHLPATGVGEMGSPVVLTIQNEGRGYLSGSVICREPWLSVSPKRFGCLAHEQCQVTVQPDLSRLPPGEVENELAIWVRSSGEDRPIAVQAEVLPAVLEVDTSTLDFGEVGRGTVADITFFLRNVGQGYLTGNIYCQAPWLMASPNRFRVFAGESVPITVKANAHDLPPGPVDQPEALVVESIDREITLDAHLQVLSPRLSVVPDQLHLGVVDLANLPAPQAELMVRNTGHGILIGEVNVTADWLDVEPADFRCQVGDEQRLHLSVTALKTGAHRQVLHFVSNAGDREVPILLQVRFSQEPDMVHVPAGDFLRGSGDQNEMAEPAEKPQTPIYLSEYWIGKYPVTNAQYAIFIADTGRRPPEHWDGNHPPTDLTKHPVTNVSWWDAAAYCRWMAEVTGKPYRLPTEAQWEKAARGTEGLIFPWGNTWGKKRCNSQAAGHQGTTPVGAYSPLGDSPVGCADMAGNVLEWVADWFRSDYYARSSVTENPYGPSSGAVKVLRGGSYADKVPGVRCAARRYSDQKLVSPEVGFRCALATEEANLDGVQE